MVCYACVTGTVPSRWQRLIISAIVIHRHWLFTGYQGPPSLFRKYCHYLTGEGVKNPPEEFLRQMQLFFHSQPVAPPSWRQTVILPALFIVICQELGGWNRIAPVSGAEKIHRQPQRAGENRTASSPHESEANSWNSWVSSREAPGHHWEWSAFPPDEF